MNISKDHMLLIIGEDFRYAQVSEEFKVVPISVIFQRIKKWKTPISCQKAARRVLPSDYEKLIV